MTSSRDVSPDRAPGRRQRYRAPDLRAFEGLTERSAYWLGFLMADGCVSGCRELVVVLHRQDAGHLRKLAAFLGCDDRPLATANNGNGRRLAIGSVALARQLIAYGVVAGRGRDHDRPVSDELASSSAFWRGVVDGDGSLKPRGIPKLELVARPALAQQFATFLLPVLGFRPRPYSHSQSDRVLMVSMGGRVAQAAVSKLYAGAATDVLERKRVAAQMILDWVPQVRSRYPWDRWGDGSTWLLAQGADYDEPRRLWESGRRAARRRNCSLELVDRGSSIELRFVSRLPS